MSQEILKSVANYGVPAILLVGVLVYMVPVFNRLVTGIIENVNKTNTVLVLMESTVREMYGSVGQIKDLFGAHDQQVKGVLGRVDKIEAQLHEIKEKLLHLMETSATKSDVNAACGELRAVKERLRMTGEGIH